MIEKTIKTLSAQIWGITIEEIESPSRKSEMVSARFQAYFLIREHTDMSLSSIGNLFGGRDHSSVLHGLQQHENYIKAPKTDPKSRIYQEKFTKLLELTGHAKVQIETDKAKEQALSVDKLIGQIQQVKVITDDASKRLAALISKPNVTCSVL